MALTAPQKKKILAAVKDPKAVRLAAKLNQKDFWGRLGVTQSGGSRYETGRGMPTPVAMLLGLMVTATVIEKDFDDLSDALTRIPGHC